MPKQKCINCFFYRNCDEDEEKTNYGEKCGKFYLDFGDYDLGFHCGEIDCEYHAKTHCIRDICKYD